MTLDDWCRKAIGVPFVQDGREYDGWDCWGLVVCAYRDVLGIELPNYTFGSVKHLVRQFRDRTSPLWQPCDRQPMAITCIYRRGAVIHAGIMVDKRRIIHVEEGIDTCLERVTNMRIEGTYAPVTK